jgi:hypothetical protein
LAAGVAAALAGLLARGAVFLLFVAAALDRELVLLELARTGRDGRRTSVPDGAAGCRRGGMATSPSYFRANSYSFPAETAANMSGTRLQAGPGVALT